MSINYAKSAAPIESLDLAGLGQITKGLSVRHPVFGKGVVTAIFRFRDGKHSIGIEFQEHGYKALAPEYAKLQLL
jgi:hypothetical protein